MCDIIRFACACVFLARGIARGIARWPMRCVHRILSSFSPFHFPFLYDKACSDMRESCEHSFAALSENADVRCNYSSIKELLRRSPLLRGISNDENLSASPRFNPPGGKRKKGLIHPACCCTVERAAGKLLSHNRASIYIFPPCYSRVEFLIFPTTERGVSLRDGGSPKVNSSAFTARPSIREPQSVRSGCFPLLVKISRRGKRLRTERSAVNFLACAMLLLI